MEFIKGQKFYYSNSTQKGIEKTDVLQIRDKIIDLERADVLRIDDEKGREYMWDGNELYRLMPLKGRFGRKKKS